MPAYEPFPDRTPFRWNRNRLANRNKENGYWFLFFPAGISSKE
jgi:hypothetical protein